MNRPCLCGRFFSFRGRMAEDKSLKYMLLTLALALTCTLVGSVRLSGADGGGGRKARGRVLRVALVGDPQVDNETEMGYAGKSVYKDLASRKDIDIAVFLGDLVNDNMTLLPESVRVIDSLPYPCFMVPGNHDRDVRGDRPMPFVRNLKTWRKVVGYVDTSFIRSNVRFILMNNVRHSDSGMTDYVGGFTGTQKHWLDSVLNVGAPALTVLATHIPFSQMKGRDSVLALVPEAARMLYVSGHTHYVSRDDSVPELIAGATCGSWWRGVKDGDGIPYALQSCGSPRGYFIADFRRGGRYDLSYKCVGRPASEQLSAWAIPDDSDTCSYRLCVNVFGGSTDGTVRVRVPRRGRGVCGKSYLCERSNTTAPEVEKVIRFNASLSREYRRTHRTEFIPLRRKPSPHLWKTTATFSGPEPAYVNVIYRDAHMRIRQRVKVNKLQCFPPRPCLFR